MIIGKMNELTAVRPTSVGMFLADDEGEEVLLPMRYVSDDLSPGDRIEVFVYTDSEDRPVAVTDKPLLKSGEIGYLTVSSISSIGAFLDWGLEKDVLLPYREQVRNLEINDRVLVALSLDPKTNRMVASMRVNRYFADPAGQLHEGDQVEVCITRSTELGWNCVVNKSFEGLIYHNEIFKKVRAGMMHTGWVYKIRDNGKLDIRLQKWGGAGMDENAEKLLGILTDSGGHISVGDKSAPEEIQRVTGMSKRNFKQAVGNLLKAGQIEKTDTTVSIK